MREEPKAAPAGPASIPPSADAPDRKPMRASLAASDEAVSLDFLGTCLLSLICLGACFARLVLGVVLLVQ